MLNSKHVFSIYCYIYIYYLTRMSIPQVYYDEDNMMSFQVFNIKLVAMKESHKIKHHHDKRRFK